MITEQQLKADCTSDIIKKMVGLAEGFEYVEETEHDVDYFIFRDKKYFTSKPELFPLLIHRAVEGWNKKNDKGYLNFIKLDIGFLSYWFNPQENKLYIFQNYQPQSLTHYECACLHCLIEVLKDCE